MTAIVIYFSRAGENYLNGTKQRITKGNTAVLAEKISHALAIESYELLSKIAYSESYDEAVQQAEKEKQASARIDYETLPINFTRVDSMFLGFPDW